MANIGGGSTLGVAPIESVLVLREQEDPPDRTVRLAGVGKNPLVLHAYGWPQGGMGVRANERQHGPPARSTGSLSASTPKFKFWH